MSCWWTLSQKPSGKATSCAVYAHAADQTNTWVKHSFLTRQIPANSGWILDGFPADITQAHLLEKALGGGVDEEPTVTNNRLNLAVDPDPPKTPAAPPPALDLALLLDVLDERAVALAVNQTGLLHQSGFIFYRDRCLVWCVLLNKQ